MYYTKDYTIFAVSLLSVVDYTNMIHMSKSVLKVHVMGYCECL